MKLKDLNDVGYHPFQEKLLQYIRHKTQNLESDLYFRVLSTFYMGQMATQMRAEVHTPHRGVIPPNIYALNLGESGMGKGYSMNLLEKGILKGFREVYLSDTFPNIAEQSIQDEAQTNSIRNSTDMAEEQAKVEREYKDCGHYLFSYDSGTGPAYKQLRTKCQIGRIGSLNMIIDEIGTNLLNNAELFATNLEAYDIGLIKAKLIKNSSDNTRSVDRDTPVPTNVLAFGTPTKLFNGGAEEREIWSLLDTGYARRFIYGVGAKTTANTTDAETLLDLLTNNNSDQSASQLASHCTRLADSSQYGRQIQMPRETALINIQYQLECEAKAESFNAHESLKKAEMQHRYFRAIKIAGCYAFVDGSHVVTEDHMYAAIKLVEDSGKCFTDQILARDKNYVKLAKYICEVDREVTHADLAEDLTFYSGSKSSRDDMIQLATAWGYKNNYLIKKTFVDNIEFFRGETLEPTDLSQLKVSVSNQMAHGYKTRYAKWEKLSNLVTAKDFHWCNHEFVDGHRHGDKVISGFNMIAVDVDNGFPLVQAQELLKEYTCLFHTTKRHTAEKNRYRILMPLKYNLNLTEKEYKQFMENIQNWLPFDADESVDQRCRKWATHKGQHHYNEGVLLDPVIFIPRTQRNEEHMKAQSQLSNMDKIQAWFAGSMGEGNRNNTLIKYALMLLDSGMDATDVEDNVIAFNNKLTNPLSVSELKATIFKTVYSKARDTN